MRIYSTTTTDRLENEARKLGFRLEIRLMEPSEEGRYFVNKEDGKPLKRPVSLGWTDHHALYAIKNHVWRMTEMQIL